ncbi:hypothetical protein L1887_56842 [Cichorium endivia]|nr:hypothetical protein L1887_56842 [Cichorium endivia]
MQVRCSAFVRQTTNTLAAAASKCKWADFFRLSDFRGCQFRNSHRNQRAPFPLFGPKLAEQCCVDSGRVAERTDGWMDEHRDGGERLRCSVHPSADPKWINRSGWNWGHAGVEPRLAFRILVPHAAPPSSALVERTRLAHCSCAIHPSSRTLSAPNQRGSTRRVPHLGMPIPNQEMPLADPPMPPPSLPLSIRALASQRSSGRPCPIASPIATTPHRVPPLQGPARMGMQHDFAPGKIAVPLTAPPSTSCEPWQWAATQGTWISSNGPRNSTTSSLQLPFRPLRIAQSVVLYKLAYSTRHSQLGLLVLDCDTCAAYYEGVSLRTLERRSHLGSPPSSSTDPNPNARLADLAAAIHDALDATSSGLQATIELECTRFSCSIAIQAAAGSASSARQLKTSFDLDPLSHAAHATLLSTHLVRPLLFLSRSNRTCAKPRSTTALAHAGKPSQLLQLQADGDEDDLVQDVDRPAASSKRIKNDLTAHHGLDGHHDMLFFGPPGFKPPRSPDGVHDHARASKHERDAPFSSDAQSHEDDGDVTLSATDIVRPTAAQRPRRQPSSSPSNAVVAAESIPRIKTERANEASDSDTSQEEESLPVKRPLLARASPAPPSSSDQAQLAAPIASERARHRRQRARNTDRRGSRNSSTCDPHRPLPLHRLHRKTYRRPEMPLATSSCVGANKSPTSSGVTKSQPPLPWTPLHNPPPRDWARNSRKVLENDLASSNQFDSIYVLAAATLTDVMQLIECEPDGPPREDDVQPAAGASVQPVPILVSCGDFVFVCPPRSPFKCQAFDRFASAYAPPLSPADPCRSDACWLGLPCPRRCCLAFAAGFSHTHHHQHTGLASADTALQATLASISASHPDAPPSASASS